MTMNSVIKSSGHKIIKSHNNRFNILVLWELSSCRVRKKRKAATVEKVKSTKQSAQVIFGVKVYDKQAEDQHKISI